MRNILRNLEGFRDCKNRKMIIADNITSPYLSKECASCGIKPRPINASTAQIKI
jgi:hypothetical protein